MELISIIVPVYKVESYLKICIDSILNQTYRNFELILVDDGSPDNCGAICDEYAQKDDRVKVIHQANKGVSGARNAALDIASGKYIMYVDSDDWVDDDILEFLYSLLKENNADVSICNYYKMDNNTDVRKTIKNRTDIYTSKEIIAKTCEDTEIGNYLMMRLYKKEVWDNVRFPVGLLYEDAYVTVDVFANVEKVVFSTAKKYYYRQHNNSITKDFSIENMEMKINAWKIKMNKAISLDNTLKLPATSEYFKALCGYWMRLIESDTKCERREEIKLELKNNLKFILNSEYVGIAFKCFLLVAFISEPLAKHIIQIRESKKNLT